METENSQYLTTRQFSAMAKVETTTIRQSYCLKGHYLHVKPFKLPNGRLRWPVKPICKVLKIDQAAA